MAGSTNNAANNRRAKRQVKLPLKLDGYTRRTNSASGSKKKPVSGSPVKSRHSRQTKSQTSPPPVMARGYQMDVHFQAGRPYARKTRRRIDLPLNVPGAEIRLPSLPRIRLTARWIVFGVLLCISAGLFFLWNSPLLRIDTAQVKGNRQVMASDINAALGVIGKPVFLVHRSALVEKLKKDFPEFSAVSIQVSLPNTIEVLVTERVPVLTWQQGQNIQLVDSEGFAFPFRLAPTMVVTPVVEVVGALTYPGLSVQDAAQLVANSVTGETLDAMQKDPVIAPLLKPEMVTAILRVAQIIPADAPLIYDAQHGIGWQDERGWQVYLGDDSDIEMKLQVYDALVDRLVAEDIQPNLISIEHVHNPYFRTES